MAELVRLEADLLGEPVGESDQTLFDTALRAHLVMLRDDWNEPLVVPGQVYSEARDHNPDAEAHTAIEFADAVHRYLEKRGLDTFKELLNREPELLSQYRDVKQAQQESN
ncbi:hypothetical protein [Haloterrigena alkaliphila]|uniref:Uncharacterized protein n=1 Tax=Haloterrigena alkaliphila TaxID=2816475 RepID=A0A8A2VD55_9EURY|nr:hypothetical protein [Haloterrigena alkaliphila]QSW98165.1 hypothetical protein J0X25_12170 [Haloterrigena alkaliphila]